VALQCYFTDLWAVHQDPSANVTPGVDSSAQVVELASLHNEMQRFPYQQAERPGEQSGAAPAPRTDH
jgi:hypothetical protein